MTDVTDKLRGLVFSAAELQSFGIFPNAFIEDYLTIIENIIEIAGAVDSGTSDTRDLASIVAALESHTSSVKAIAYDNKRGIEGINDIIGDDGKNIEELRSLVSSLESYISSVKSVAYKNKRDIEEINAAVEVLGYASYSYTTGGISTVSSPTVIDIANTENSNSGSFSNTVDAITIGKSGLYRINTDVSMNCSVDASSFFEAYITLNGSELIGTTMGLWGVDADVTASCQIDQDLEAGDVVRVVVDRKSGFYDDCSQVNNGTRISFKEI